MAIVNATVLVVAGFYMREIGSKFYLLGQAFLFFAIILSSLSVFGFIDFYEFHSYIVIVAILIDLVLLFVAQSLKTKHNLTLLQQSKIALIENSRYSSMGLAIHNITHQWKHPLTHLGLSMLMIETILKNKKEELIPALERELPKISYSIALMKKTMDEFSSYYSKGIAKSDFNPKKSVEYLISILQSKILLKNANFTLDIDENLAIHTYEHIFSNIVMILIDNSLDEFSPQSSKNNITITLKKGKKPNQYELLFLDNAGGVKIEPIEKVFEYFISNKEDGQIHGAGLAMLKMFAQERLNGEIKVQNRDGGTLFVITFFG